MFAPPFSGPAACAGRANEELRTAIDRNDVAAVQTALSHGANVNAHFSHGGTALMLAAEGGDVNMAKILLTGGANVHSRCGCG